MFLDNRYAKIYYKLIESAQNRTLPEDEYIESHHIVPRSMGGSDDPTNLVNLTYDEHRFCHKLLVHMTTGVNKGKMSFASMLMNKYNYTTTKNAARDYLRKLHTGKIPITNGIIDKVCFKGQEIPEGWWPGFCQKTLENKLEKNKGKVYITDGLAIRSLKRDEVMPEGWWHGQPDWLIEKNRIANVGQQNGMYQRQFITDGVNNSTIKHGDIIPEGWKLGKSEQLSINKSNAKLGSKNPNYKKATANSKSIEVFGVTYRSMSEAIRNGYSRRTIENLYKERGKNKC
jgi:hypothetical protein